MFSHQRWSGACVMTSGSDWGIGVESQACCVCLSQMAALSKQSHTSPHPPKTMHRTERDTHSQTLADSGTTRSHHGHHAHLALQHGSFPIGIQPAVVVPIPLCSLVHQGDAWSSSLRSDHYTHRQKYAFVLHSPVVKCAGRLRPAPPHRHRRYRRSHPLAAPPRRHCPRSPAANPRRRTQILCVNCVNCPP